MSSLNTPKTTQIYYSTSPFMWLAALVTAALALMASITGNKSLGSHRVAYYYLYLLRLAFRMKLQLNISILGL